MHTTFLICKLEETRTFTILKFRLVSVHAAKPGGRPTTKCKTGLSVPL